MPTGVVVDLPGGTCEQYLRMVERSGEWPPAGAILHLAGPTADGWRVVEVWASEAELDAYLRATLESNLTMVGGDTATVSCFTIHSLLGAV